MTGRGGTSSMKPASSKKKGSRVEKVEKPLLRKKKKETSISLARSAEETTQFRKES